MNSFCLGVVVATTLAVVAKSQTCGCTSCTQDALSVFAGDFRCGDRINWLKNNNNFSEYDACVRVASEEFPNECAPCDPTRCNDDNNVSLAPTPPSSNRCGCAISCTNQVLARPATDNDGTFSCGSRIDWLLQQGSHDKEKDACQQVAEEFPDICGPACHPLLCGTDSSLTPTESPTKVPTKRPTESPTKFPTRYPTASPTKFPTRYPTASPTEFPTRYPTASPTTKAPTKGPTEAPTRSPTKTPTRVAEEDYFCGCESCTQKALDASAGQYTCGARMAWLRNTLNYSDQQACIQIAVDEFPTECGTCNPIQCNQGPIEDPDPSDLIWSDEFDGLDGSAPDPSKWSHDTGGDGWGNREEQHYTDRRDNSYVSNGYLHVRAIKENFQGNGYTSARLVTKNKGDWKHGRFRVRARLQQCTATGTWPAIWMLPTDWLYGGWPNSGEIDIMEHVGFDTGTIHGTVHTGAFNHIIGTQRGGSTYTDVSQWHIYETIWTESKVEFLIDGTKYYEFLKVQGASSGEWPFDERFHLILNIAVGGSWGGSRGIDSAAFEGNGQIMEVDWVRVYRNPISTLPPTSSPPASNNLEIKVMSYNTDYTGYYDGRIQGFGAKIREVGADVVGVQECQNPSALASASGYSVVTGTGTQNYIFYNPAKLQILDSGWSPVQRDEYAPRTFTWAKIRVIGTNEEFIFFNTHLPHRHGQASNVNTHAQIGRSLLTKRDEIGATNTPTVVVCDCNPFASNGAPQGSFEDSLAQQDIPRLYIARGNPGFGGLDKIFASSKDWNGSAGSDVGTGGSDHPAIAITLTGKTTSRKQEKTNIFQH